MKKIIFITTALLLLETASLFSQGIFRNTELVIGGSLQQQDRRLFSVADKASLLMREKSIFDYEVNLYLKRNFFTKHRFQTSIGLGYSRFTSVFSRPYDQGIFYENAGPNRVVTSDYRIIRRHIIHKAIAPVSVSYRISRSRSVRIGLQAIPSFSFRRKILWPLRFDGSKGHREDLTRGEFAPYNLEINLFVGMRVLKKMNLSLSYRLKHIQKLDRIIFNNLLFRTFDPEFLRQKTDTYNPVKFTLSVGYLF